MTDDGVKYLAGLLKRIEQLERMVKLLVESGCHCDAAPEEWGHHKVCQEIRRVAEEIGKRDSR